MTKTFALIITCFAAGTVLSTCICTKLDTAAGVLPDGGFNRAVPVPKNADEPPAGQYH